MKKDERIGNLVRYNNKLYTILRVEPDEKVTIKKLTTTRRCTEIIHNIEISELKFVKL